MYHGCQVVHILAHDKNKCIGKDNTIPWRCSADMKHFANMTKGKVCIMGRKTFESINPPLTGRRVIVVSSNPTPTLRRAVDVATLHYLVGSIDDALQHAAVMSLGGEIMIIGGRTIYEQTAAVADKLIISEINTVVEDGDTFFDWDVLDHTEIVPHHFEVNK